MASMFNRNVKDVVPCPHCKKPVTLNSSDLIDGKDIKCPHCGFTMDTKKISKKLKDLEDDIKRKFNL